MISNEQRAHDLAILFVKQEIDQVHQEYDTKYDEATVYDMYKTAYDNFFDKITMG